MRVTVVGDTLLDVDLDGTSERRSPDQGTPVVDIRTRRTRAGGAGLAARLLHDDGVEVELVTAIAADDAARELVGELGGPTLVAAPTPAPTPVKSRVSIDGRAFARLDTGCTGRTRPVVTAELLAAIARAEAILVSDYGRGVADDPAVRDALARRACDVPLVWDPHPGGRPPVPGARAATPNIAELRHFAGSDDPLSDAAQRVRATWRVDALAVTLGEQGAHVCAHPLSWVEPADPVVTADPCGAGDRFCASLLRELASGRALPAAVRRAVGDAGRYLRAGGVAALGAPTLDRVAR